MERVVSLPRARGARRRCPHQPRLGADARQTQHLRRPGDGAVRPLHGRVQRAMPFNPVIRRFAERLRKTGKPFKVVVVAAMRKLLTIPNIMLKEKQPWNAGKLQKV
jgi:transposase